MRFSVSVFLSVCAALFFSTHPALAQISDMDPHGPPDPSQDLPLDGDALTALFMDRTHRGYYELGDWDTLDPAFTERMNADGTVLHNRAGIDSEGTWQTRANVVCFRYQDLDGGCFRIYQRGTCNYAMSATTNELVAITVLDGDTPDCEPSYA